MALALRLPNPSRAYVTDELWWFWLEFRRMEPAAKLGGIYAKKAGYHNLRKALPRKDYSVLSAKDRAGPADKSAAIDITFPDAQRGDYRTIAKYSKRLLSSGRDLSDERGNYLREFFGNADSDREVEGWDFQAVCAATSDDSHLWHIHLSFLRAYVGNLKAMRAVLSILAGESVKVWRAKEAALLKPKPKVPAPRPPVVAVPLPVTPPKPIVVEPPRPAPLPTVPPLVVVEPVRPATVQHEAAGAVTPTGRVAAEPARPVPRNGWESFVAMLRAWLAGRTKRKGH